MIKLSIQDKFDGTNKIQELRNAIGTTIGDPKYSDKTWILVSVSKSGDRCTLKQKKGGNSTIREHSWRTWNALFF